MDLQHQEKPKQNQSQQTYKSQKNLTSDSEQNSTIPNTHFRVNSITQLQDKANQSAKVKSFEKLQSNANYSDALSQLQAFDKGLNKTTNSRTEPIQRNNTGIPDHLKSGMENVSGMSLDQVKVHYNSSKPASVQAHAYAQGNQVHLASGQEKHLPHELGHVVQQAQGRVKPTTQINGANINDDKKLEKEADILGKKALQQKAIEKTPKKPNFNFSSSKQLITDPEKARAFFDQGDEKIVDDLTNQLLEHLEEHFVILHDAALKPEIIDAAPEIIKDVLAAMKLQFERMEEYDNRTRKPKKDDRTPEEEKIRNDFKRGTTHFNDMVKKYEKYLKFDHSGNMGLWSGGKMLSDYAHKHRGLKMLERTDFGLIFNDKPMVGWSNFADVMSGLWDALSSKFVELNKVAGMEVHVLLRNYEGDSTLNRQEIPQLKDAGATIFYHAIWGNDKSDGKEDSFREIDQNINLLPTPSAGDGTRSPGEATKRLILYVDKLERGDIMAYAAAIEGNMFQVDEVHKNFREEFKGQQFPTDEASANDIARKIDEKENARRLPSKPE